MRHEDTIAMPEPHPSRITHTRRTEPGTVEPETPSTGIPDEDGTLAIGLMLVVLVLLALLVIAIAMSL